MTTETVSCVAHATCMPMDGCLCDTGYTGDGTVACDGKPLP